MTGTGISFEEKRRKMKENDTPSLLIYDKMSINKNFTSIFFIRILSSLEESFFIFDLFQNFKEKK